MNHWKRRIPFKVDISGIIHIMGSALYSRPEAALRELIQNAHDAIMRRRQCDLNFRGRIDIRQCPEDGVIEFHDDGFGLSADDAESYLGTLGIGLTGLLKGEHPSSTSSEGGSDDLIGMFGIGLFSAFMLAERMVVESRRVDATEAIRWDAEGGVDIELSSCKRDQVGTTIRLYLKPMYSHFAQNGQLVERIIQEYAEFLSIPVFLNGSAARVNVSNAEWFEATPDDETLEMELANYFDEEPLDVIPVQSNSPRISGALYISAQRTPGFADDAVVTATLRRMVISRDIRGLLPEWASFLRGVLELSDCAPTASREDLVKNETFAAVAMTLHERLFEHLESLAKDDPVRLQSILSWHRYTFAGAALSEPRLRAVLRSSYEFPTSSGPATFDSIIESSDANSLFEADFEKVIWYNTDRRQEGWVNSLFASQDVPCVHTLRSFEESLLATMAGDVGVSTDVRFVSPSSQSFSQQILHIGEIDQAPPEWTEFFHDTGAKISIAEFSPDQPVMAFLNERHELKKTFDELKTDGTVPAGFQRLIDNHFADSDSIANEVLLNRKHRLVARALEQKTTSPLASVLRLLVVNALRNAGASLQGNTARTQASDLDWIAECLWGKDQS